MWRDRILRVVLVLVGLMFIAGVFSLVRFNDPAKAWEQMLGSVYVTLGVFLVIAALHPAAHRSLISFTAWSSVVHGCVMGLQAHQGAIPHSDLWRAFLPMVAIGVVLLVLAPGRNSAESPGFPN